MLEEYSFNTFTTKIWKTGEVMDMLISMTESIFNVHTDQSIAGTPQLYTITICRSKERSKQNF